MAKTIRYSIDKNGNVTLDFNGFRGKACIQEFQKLIEALKSYGITIDGDVKQEKKAEYYMQEEVVEQ